MHQIQCKCGALRGHVQGAGVNNRILCYCSDCQAFANFLGSSAETLNPQGGTEIVQLAQSRLRFTQGKEHLALLKLSDKGLLRWYASCCNTPIGNTLGNPKLSFIGLIHCALDHSKMDADFGEHIAVAKVDTAIGEPKPKQRGLAGIVGRFLAIILTDRIGSKYKQSPLFNDAGQAIVQARVLTADERKNLYK